MSADRKAPPKPDLSGYDPRVRAEKLLLSRHIATSWPSCKWRIWLTAVALSLLVGVAPAVFGEGPDPEALQVTSDSVTEAMRDVQLALDAERIEARGPR